MALATDGHSIFAKVKDGGVFMLPLPAAEAATGGPECVDSTVLSRPLLETVM